MRLKKNKTLFRSRAALHGFSLIELMTVAGIIGIMTSIVLVSFSSGRTDEALKTSAREVANALREAQNDALSGFRPSSVPSQRIVCWFSLEQINSTDAMLKVWHSHPNNNCTSGLSYEEVRTLKLQNGATFGSTVAYGFRLPHGQVVSPSDGSLVSGMKTITITAAGKNIGVCLDPASGAIRETAVGGSC